MIKQNFKPLRKNYNYTQSIQAAPEVVFPLLCPERETEWLYGWKYKMIYSKSGVAEPEAIFSTQEPGEEETIWIITIHDPINKIVQFARVTPFNRTSTLYIKVEPKDGGSSYVHINYLYTGLTEEGNSYIENYSDEAFFKMIKFWEDSMNYFLQSGKLLKGKE